jgi:hypothetical protein|tara:strand:+ start:220 stop:834 length:615 start_codon:yes stop_codon:yes gene_type:complete
MNNLLPEVVDEVEPVEIPDIDLDNGDNNEEEEEPIEQLPEPIKKEPIPTEDIFKDAPAPVIAKPKKKRTMTPLMLEKLALSRAKGNETRRKNKEARLKGEMPTPTQKKKIVKEQEEEKKRPVVNNIVHETKNITNNITHEDIEKIVNQSTKKTLEEYDTVRKQRKAAKQIVKHKEIEQEKVKKTILAAQGYAYGQPNFYANCFG